MGLNMHTMVLSTLVHVCFFDIDYPVQLVQNFQDLLNIYLLQGKVHLKGTS